MSASRQRLRLEIADHSARHFLVRHEVSGIEPDSLELFLPIWAPGSYTVRDYAGFVVDVAVSGPGHPHIEKVESGRWSVTGCEGRVELEYRIFAPELGVRSNDITDAHAFVHPPATFLGVEGRLHESIELEVETPKDWKVYTALEERDGLRFGRSVRHGRRHELEIRDRRAQRALDTDQRVGVHAGAPVNDAQRSVVIGNERIESAVDLCTVWRAAAVRPGQL